MNSLRNQLLSIASLGFRPTPIRWKGICATLFMLMLALPAVSQQRVYFVDGYHGGIYGHYPIEWKTRFITDQLSEHPEWRIGLEIEPETWDTVQLRTPADYAQFKAIAADKRIEFTNPSYAQPYCYNVSGESIIRQFAYGIQKTRSHFPEVEFVTYSVEEPCFTSSLPQILNLFGFKYASLKCPNTLWGGYTAAYGGELVNWIGPDGSSILTSPRHACEELEPNSVWQTTAWGNEKRYLDACKAAGIAHPVGMCYQDAGWKYGPWIGSGDNIRNNSIYVTWREYFEHITDRKTTENYRMPQEDVRASLVWGSQALQRIAQQVRTSENKLTTAEKLGTIALICNGYRYNQATMDEAWRTLMLAQHHDSWIVPYNRLNKKGTWADNIRLWTQATNTLCDSIITEAGSSFASGKATRGEWALRIYNTAGMPRTETIRVALPTTFANNTAEVTSARGKRIASTTVGGELLFMAEVPAFGYASYIVKPGKSLAHITSSSQPQGDYVLENSIYRIVIDPTRGGAIKSLIDKRSGDKEYVDQTSDYAFGELRGHFYEQGRFRSSIESSATICVLDDNAHIKSIRINGHIDSHPFTQTITLREGDPAIDFELQIDWQSNIGIGAYAQNDAYKNNNRAFYDDQHNLGIFFPAALRSPELSKNAPFDVCKSTLDDTHFTTWDNIKHNIILNWVDIAEPGNGHSLALFSDHTTSYSFGKDRPLGLTLQFAGNGLWGCNYDINGPTRMRFALVPHQNQWDKAGINDQSLQWNDPLICRFETQAAIENRSLIDLGTSGYELVAAYPQQQAIIVRLFNAAGDNNPQTLRFGFAVSKAEIIDLNGQIISSCALHTKGGRSQIEIQAPRFGLQTLRLTK